MLTASTHKKGLHKTVYLVILTPVHIGSPSQASSIQNVSWLDLQGSELTGLKCRMLTSAANAAALQGKTCTHPLNVLDDLSAVLKPRVRILKFQAALFQQLAYESTNPSTFTED